MIMFNSVSVFFCFFNLFLTFVTSDNILGCGGFVKSDIAINFSLVEIKLYTKQGTLKYQTDCAPNNGYYLIPLYDKGEFVLKIEPPARWIFEPKEVPLLIDGQNDFCSQGKDINFYFKGFSIKGKVISRGHSIGPSGVTITLKTNKALHTTTTGSDGQYSFSKILPGNYTISAQHPRWQFDVKEVKVTVDDKLEEIKENLVVSGYDVQGQVSSDGEPIKGVKLLLFSKEANVKVQDCIKKPVEGYSDKTLGQPLCYVTSQDDGKFVFPVLSPGEYTIVPFYKGESSQFDVTPSKLKFTLSHSSHVLTEKFKLQGFSVVGQVLAAPGGPPVSGARVWLNDQQQTETKKDGVFTFDSMKAGTYKIQVMKENILFEPAIVKITPSASQLPAIIAQAFEVCGKLHILRLPPGLDLHSLRMLTIESTDSPSSPPSSIRTNDKGEYCTSLKRGKYKITPVIAVAEHKAGLRFQPDSLSINVDYSPIADKDFKQFFAKVSGEVKCIDSCRGTAITLIPKLKGATEPVTFTLFDKTKFNFDTVLPGEYEVRLVKEEWCWANNVLEVNVGTKDVKNLKFTQSGYVMNIVTSHATLIQYTNGDEKGTYDAIQGSNRLCISKWGIYEITTEGCHRFSDKKLLFNTDKPTVVILQASHHLLSGSITTNKQVQDMELEINITSYSGEKKNTTVLNQFKIDANPKTNTYVYNFKFWVQSKEIIQLKPRSSQLLFTPASQTFTAMDRCMENLIKFDGKLGLFIRGKIIPPLEGVDIFLGDGNQVLEKTPVTKTDKMGEYVIGPLDNGEEYVTQAKKHGYVLTRNKQFDFDAFKLAEIAVKVTGEDDQGIGGVLLSLSGGLDYRQNSLTLETGEMHFLNLEPGQYFLRPVLKEFNFNPPSTIIDLSEGMTVNISLKGIRVAFSCYGNITSLTGEPEPGVLVEAVGINTCKDSQEEASSEAEGNYRIRGLKPGCHYQVRVKKRQEPHINLEHATPLARTVEVQNNDILGINVIVFRRPTQMDIAGNVVTDKEHLSTLKVKLFRDESADQVVHTITLGQGTFFQMPSIPIDGRTYTLRLESSLSRTAYNYILAQETIRANISYQHVTLKFSPTFRGADSDLHQGSHYALPLAILAIIVACSHKQILPMSTYVAEFIHNIRNPAISTHESVSTESTEKKKKIKVKKI